MNSKTGWTLSEFTLMTPTGIHTNKTKPQSKV